MTNLYPEVALDEADAEALRLRTAVDGAWEALGWPWVDRYASLAEAIRAMKEEERVRMKDEQERV
jgi:hypothetical protein